MVFFYYRNIIKVTFVVFFAFKPKQIITFAAD